MKIGPIGIPELLIILVVVLLIFGPKNLPKLGSALGKTVKNLREGMGGDKESDAVETVEQVAEDEPAKPVAAIEEGIGDAEGDAPKKKVTRRVKVAE